MHIKAAEDKARADALRRKGDDAVISDSQKRWIARNQRKRPPTESAAEAKERIAAAKAEWQALREKKLGEIHNGWARIKRDAGACRAETARVNERKRLEAEARRADDTEYEMNALKALKEGQRAHVEQVRQLRKARIEKREATAMEEAEAAKIGRDVAAARVVETRSKDEATHLELKATVEQAVVTAKAAWEAQHECELPTTTKEAADEKAAVAASAAEEATAAAEAASAKVAEMRALLVTMAPTRLRMEAAARTLEEAAAREVAVAEQKARREVMDRWAAEDAAAKAEAAEARRAAAAEARRQQRAALDEHPPAAMDEEMVERAEALVPHRSTFSSRVKGFLSRTRALETEGVSGVLMEFYG